MKKIMTILVFTVVALVFGFVAVASNVTAEVIVGSELVWKDYEAPVDEETSTEQEPEQGVVNGEISLQSAELDVTGEDAAVEKEEHKHTYIYDAEIGLDVCECTETKEHTHISENNAEDDVCVCGKAILEKQSVTKKFNEFMYGLVKVDVNSKVAQIIYYVSFGLFGLFVLADGIVIGYKFKKKEKKVARPKKDKRKKNKKGDGPKGNAAPVTSSSFKGASELNRPRVHF